MWETKTCIKSSGPSDTMGGGQTVAEALAKQHVVLYNLKKQREKNIE